MMKCNDLRNDSWAANDTFSFVTRTLGQIWNVLSGNGARTCTLPGGFRGTCFVLTLLQESRRHYVTMCAVCSLVNPFYLVNRTTFIVVTCTLQYCNMQQFESSFSNINVYPPPGLHDTSFNNLQISWHLWNLNNFGNLRISWHVLVFPSIPKHSKAIFRRFWHSISGHTAASVGGATCPWNHRLAARAQGGDSRETYRRSRTVPNSSEQFRTYQRSDDMGSDMVRMVRKYEKDWESA